MKFSEIVLFGMPNSGKSTVFNALTKGDAKIGNWHGVTVEIKEGLLKTNPGVKVFDLPGVYSLFPVTLEEKSAIDKVISTNGLIVALIEASTLNIALESVFKLIRKNKRVLIAVNMVKELNKRGGSVDFELLKKSLPVPLIYGDFNTKTEIESLINAINNYNTQTLKIDNYMLNLAEISKFFTPPKYKESFFDKIALHKVFGTVLFLLVFLSSFYLAFGDYGIGKPISGFLSKLVIENLGFITKNFFEKHGVNTFLTAFTVDGIIGGVGGIFVFLPQILVLVGVLTFLELTGYMSRVAYLSDNLLRKTGLNGRAVFSALMGLGCTAVAVSTTNGLENNNVRKKVVLTSGMISCSAKVPSLMLIASAISSITEFSFMVILYAFGAVLTFLQVALSNKIVKSDKRVPLVMELAPIRLVKIGDFLREIKKALKGFIVKICTVIFIISCFLFLLKSLSIEGKFLQNGYENSILYYIGNLFKFIFYPIGINDWRISSAMISGLFAKEGIATTLISLFPSKLPYKTASIIALSVFFYVYTPCVTAIFSVAESLGKGFSIKFAFLQFFEALFYSYLIYYLISYPIPTVIAVLSILGVSTAVIKYKKHRKTI